MKWIVWTVLALVIAVAAIACVGYLLPQNHEASRSTEFPRPPADVYAIVADIDHYQQWWTDMEKVEVMVIERSPPSRFATKIADPNQPFGGTWTYDIVPAGEGRSRLTITERGEIYNPIFRALARFVFGYNGTMDSCLAALQRKLI